MPNGKQSFLVLLVLLAAALPAAAGDLVGAVRHHVVEAEDTLLDIALASNLGYVELVAANPGIDPWLPEPGSQVLLPTAHLLPEAPRRGIVVNLADMRLYWFREAGKPPQTFPIGIGRDDWETRLGATAVVRKRIDPTWVPTASIRAARPELPASIGPGPDNPLGRHALDLGWRHYVIHGTNQPYGVGRRVSSGCVRMYPDDIATLFAGAPVGTPVTVVDQPLKLGWDEGALYLEVHPTQRQADEIEDRGRFTVEPIVDIEGRVRRAAADKAIDWDSVARAVSERRGIPVRITR